MIITLIKGITRKLILYSTAPGTREIVFTEVYLHRIMRTRSCIICDDTFWTIGEARVCRKMSCYKLNRG